MPTAVTTHAHDVVAPPPADDEPARKAYFEAKRAPVAALPATAAASAGAGAAAGATAGAGALLLQQQPQQPFIITTASGMTIAAVGDAAAADAAAAPAASASPLAHLMAAATGSGSGSDSGSGAADAGSSAGAAGAVAPFASEKCQCLGKPMVVGDLQLVVGKALTAMTEHTQLYRDPNTTPQQLRAALDAEGYLLLRGVLPVAKVNAARAVVLEVMRSDFSGMLDLSAGKPLAEAHIAKRQKGVLLTGFQSITRHPDTLQLLEGDELATVLSSLFGSGPATFDNKWVRVHGFNDFTDEHTDFYRFSGSAQRMVTCWVPLGDYHPTQGTLAVCCGSHKLAGYTADTYGSQTKVELPPDYAKVRDTAQWKTAHFRPGDVVVFDIRTIHASTANTTQRYRVSMDTRWQPAACVPPEAACMYRHFPYLQRAPSAGAAAAGSSAAAGAVAGSVRAPVRLHQTAGAAITALSNTP